MANLYGVANTGPIAVTSAIAAAQNCPAGVETNVASATLAGLDASGFYYPLVWVVIQFIMGATAPTGITLGIRIGAGADIGVAGMPPSLLVNSATFIFSSFLIGSIGQAPWQAPGSVLNFTVNPTGQAVTAGSTGSRVLMHLYRAPDQ